MAALTTIKGEVTRARDNGFLLDDGEWYWISKFAKPAPIVPVKGQVVTVGVDTKGFARSVEVVGGDWPPTTAPSTSPAPSTREQTITRLAVLKAAAGFLATRPDAKSADVLRVAEVWEGWVTR